MSWGSRVEDVDEMALLVQEAEQWLEDQKPVDNLPFDGGFVELQPDDDAFVGGCVEIKFVLVTASARWRGGFHTDACHLVEDDRVQIGRAHV